MDIGKYKQAMSYLLNDKATLKTFALNPDAKLSDNDPIGYATGGRVGFKDGSSKGRPIIGVAYERPEVLKIIKNKLKDTVEKKDGFKVVNWSEEKTNPMLIKEFKKNGIKLTNKEFINKAINKIFEQNNWIDPLQYRREIVVDSFMKHLDTIGEFDGEEKFAKKLKPFLKKEYGKEYKFINQDFKDWRAGKFEVSTVDRDLLSKKNLNEIKNWIPRKTNIKSVQRREQLEFLNNLNNKNISLDNAKSQFVKKFSTLNDPFQTFNQRVNQLNILKIEGKLPTNKEGTTFKTYPNIKIGERAPWLKAGLTDVFAGNYSKIIQAADVLNAEGKAKEAKRLYDAAEKFFSPNDGIFRKAGGQAEHPFSRKYGGTADQQLKVNSLIQGDLNSFKKTNFDDPVNQAIEKYNISKDDKVKKSLQKEIELRKQFMNYITGSKEFGGIVDPVEFTFTPDEVKVNTNVKPIDKIKNFDVDIFKQRGEAYGTTASEIGKELNLLTKEGEIANKKIALNKIENILNKAGVTNEENKAINLISNQLNSGIDPELLGKLFSKEIGLVTNAAKKITSAGIDVADIFVSIGKTPAGRIAGGAITALFAAPELSRGNYKQAVRDVIPWFESLKIPKTDIDIGIGSKQGDLIKYAEEKNYGQNSLNKIYKANDIQNEIDSLTSKIENLKNQTYTEDPLGGGYTNFDDVIKKSQLELEALEKQKKELNIKKLDWQNLFNTAYSFNEEKYKSHKQNLFGKYILSRSDSDKDILEQELYRDIGKLNQNLLLEHNIYIPEKKDEQPLQENLTDYSYVSAADGGRVKLKDGTDDPDEKPIIPIDPLSDDIKPKNIMDTKLSRRQVIGGLGVAAGLPIIAKLIKEGKAVKAARVAKVATKVLPNVHGMPEWFPSLVAKIEKEGKFPLSDYAITDNVKIKELSIPSRTGKGPNETYIMTKYPNGKIEIHADIKGGAYDQPFELHYTPPESFVDETTGKVIKEPGDFSIVEQRPRVTGGPHDADWELDWDIVSKDQALSDIEKVEQTVTGKITDPKAAKARAAQRDYYYNSPYEDIVDRYGDIGLHYDDIAKEE